MICTVTDPVKAFRAVVAGASLICLAGGASAQGAGQIEFNNNCRTCHTVNEGDNRLGPSLHHVVGREAGTLPDYNFSGAMASSSVVWDKATLDRFIEHPDAVVQGHKMKPFTGIADAEVRSAIVDYLAALSQ